MRKCILCVWCSKGLLHHSAIHVSLFFMHSFMHFSHLLLITGMAFSLARKILCRFLVILNAVKMQKKLCETISSGLFYHKSLILEKAKPSRGFLSPLYTQISDVTDVFYPFLSNLTHHWPSSFASPAYHMMFLCPDMVYSHPTESPPFSL